MQQLLVKTDIINHYFSNEIQLLLKILSNDEPAFTIYYSKCSC